ncbi:hypothetical protein [Thermus sp.]|uniref:hypothetical protein n=1 Tax=Thermus sp. TaxID=275 RepID=UPI003318FB21
MLRHRLNLEALERAPEGVRLELLDGEVYERAPIGSGHAGLVTYLAKVTPGHARSAACQPR